MYISSDTNVWNDFREADFLDVPFRLPFHFHIADIVYQDEMSIPGYFDDRIVALGLHHVEVTEEEIADAERLNQESPGLSIQDCIALSIARCRKWTLLTGDRSLSTRARKEGVEVRGTLWILEELTRRSLCTRQEMTRICNRMEGLVRSGRLRLPLAELQRIRESL